MTFPNNNDLSTTNYLQGVILAEVGCTVFLYIVFKIVHYLAWGYEEDTPPKEGRYVFRHRCIFIRKIA